MSERPLKCVASSSQAPCQRVHNNPRPPGMETLARRSISSFPRVDRPPQPHISSLGQAAELTPVHRPGSRNTKPDALS